MKEEMDVIWTSKLIINENVMKYENSVVQMSNVSRCEVTSMPEKPYPIWSILGIQLCVAIVAIQIIEPKIPFYQAYIPALVGFVVCAINLLIIFAKNKNLGMYLAFELNSGGILLFECEDISFLESVHKAVIDCFNYRDISYVVNFNKCTIKDTQIGKYNTVSISNSISEDEWKKLESFFNNKMETIEKEYYFLANEAEDYIRKRDRNGLKEFINKYASEFAKGIFCNMASTGILELLQKLGIWI